MPRVPMESMSDSAKVWLFGSKNELTGEEQARIMAVIDRFLDDWSAHGTPLPAAASIEDDRFLIVAADDDGVASGCSIDRLFRQVEDAARTMGTSFTDSAWLFYRDAAGHFAAATRSGFRKLAENGTITPETTVADITIDSLASLRKGWKKPAAQSWHRAFLPASVAATGSR